jgi:hypothetical protein
MTDDLATGAAAFDKRSAGDTTRTARARQLPLIMDDTVAVRLGVTGRTEDVAVSPDGRRLAVACFGASRVALVEFSVERDHDGERPSALLLTSVVMVDCLGLLRPHGLAFVDDATLLVANRGSQLVLVDLPKVGDDAPCVTVQGLVVADATSPVPVHAPGSVVTLDAGGGLTEVLVCNNEANTVTRHVVDTHDGCVVVDAEVLLHNRLDIPDGVTVSPSGEWLAISNHCSNEVFLYRYDAELGPDDEPHGVLDGANFPHGLRFSADSRRIVVADSGLPYVHTYAADDGDWGGRRKPIRSTRVMEDDEYLAGKYNTQEGGPKGLATLDGGRVVVVTSEHQPLAFFDAAEVGFPTRSGDAVPPGRSPVGGRLVNRAKAQTANVRAELEQLRRHSEWQGTVLADREQTIAELSRRLTEVEARVADGHANARELLARIDDLEAEAAACRAESERLRAAMHELEGSTSWRLTGPMRAIADRVRRSS